MLTVDKILAIVKVDKLMIQILILVQSTVKMVIYGMANANNVLQVHILMKVVLVVFVLVVIILICKLVNVS